jgi:hypothetical protein
MRSAETSMQKHLITAKPNERATRSARPSGNRWPKADGRFWRQLVRQADIGSLALQPTAVDSIQTVDGGFSLETPIARADGSGW